MDVCGVTGCLYTNLDLVNYSDPIGGSATHRLSLCPDIRAICFLSGTIVAFSILSLLFSSTSFAIFTLSADSCLNTLLQCHILSYHLLQYCHHHTTTIAVTITLMISCGPSKINTNFVKAVFPNHDTTLTKVSTEP